MDNRVAIMANRVATPPNREDTTVNLEATTGDLQVDTTDSGHSLNMCVTNIIDKGKNAQINFVKLVTP